MAWTVVHRVFALGGINISQRAYNDATDDLPAHVAIASADANAVGVSYHATGAAATGDTVKASAGLLKSFWYSGTGTTGTILIIDGSTTIFTVEIPASVITGALPLPPEGMAFGTSIKITTTGAGNTCLSGYI